MEFTIGETFAYFGRLLHMTNAQVKLYLNVIFVTLDPNPFGFLCGK